MENSAPNHTRKRKQKLKSVDPLDVKRQSFRNDNITIDDLPDEMLIAILSRMSLRDAVRTSVLARRWRYLWMFIYEKLEFHNRDFATGAIMEREKFKALVHHVLKLHKAPRVDRLVIRLDESLGETSDFDEWVYFFMDKEVKRFELNFSNDFGYSCCYKFPNIETLLLRKVNKSSLVSLRSLKLVNVGIEDQLVHYFLASCPFLEHLCIRESDATKNLKIVDPLPNLKELEISDCLYLQSMEISATNLVSFTYQGRVINLPFKKTPNLTELTLGEEYCQSFIWEHNKHSSYSVQLVKLVLYLQPEIPSVRRRRIVPPDLPQLYALKRLELNIVSKVGRSLLFFTSLIKASPHLQELNIEVVYMERLFAYSDSMISATMPFPEVSSAEASEFYHKNLKVAKMVGYCGCESEAQFLLQLSKIAPSLEMVVINTDCDYYRYYFGLVVYRSNREDGEKPIKEEEKKKKGMTMTRFHATKHAEKLTSRFPSETKFVIT